MKSVLLIDDDPVQHKILSFFLKSSFGEDAEFTSAFDLEEAVAHLEKQSFEMIMLDNRLAPYKDYTDTIDRIRAVSQDSLIYLISAARDHEKFGDYQTRGILGVIDKFELRESITNGLLS